MRELRYSRAEPHTNSPHPFAFGGPRREGAFGHATASAGSFARGIVRVFDLRPQNTRPVKASFWFHP